MSSFKLYFYLDKFSSKCISSCIKSYVLPSMLFKYCSGFLPKASVHSEICSLLIVHVPKLLRLLLSSFQKEFSSFGDCECMGTTISGLE